jgi:Fe-S cluster assembly protein SufD
MTTWHEKNLTLLQEKSALRPISSLNQWQTRALEKFLGVGFPTRHNEDWKYTNVNSIMDSTYKMPAKKSISVDLNELTLASAHQIVFINGQYQSDQSDLQELPEGVLVSKASHVIEKWELYFQLTEMDSTFADLNAALMTEGLFIYVPKGVIIEKPIHFIYLNTDGQENVMQHPRHLLVADEESQLSLIEEYVGEKAHYFNNVVMHVVAKSGANVSLYKIQDESLNAEHIANTHLTQSRDSTVTSYVFSMGSALNRENLTINFKEPGASCHLYGLYLPLTKQHIDHHTTVEHRVPNCFSQQIYKGIIGEKGHAVFNGKVMVHQNAQKTAAYQDNRNVLLAKDAQIDTKPELQIHADDVKCTHGATVGQLDEKALFYIRSRGIPLKKARELLIKAFAEEIVLNIGQPEIVRYIRLKITEKLKVLT